MASQHLEAFRWLLPVDDARLQDRLRAMEARVVEEARPILRDPVAREHAHVYWLSKRHPEEGATEDQEPGVLLTLVAPPAAEAALHAAVQRRAPSARPLTDDPDLVPVLHPIGQDYRQGLREVTDLALDLHADDPEHLVKHQCWLIQIGCDPADPRYRLHAYLLEHSETYAAWLGESTAGGAGPWSWAHEELWARLFTPGPSMGLAAPLTRLWNIVVGLTPQRGWTPHDVARRAGIECQWSR